MAGGFENYGRRSLVIAHDAVATAAALLASFAMRFEPEGLAERMDGLVVVVPLFVLYATAVYWYFDLYRSKWRFASLPDLAGIVRATTVLALTLLVLDYVLVAHYFYGHFFFGKITIALYFVLQVFFLGGARLAYRYFRFTRTRRRAELQDHITILILGRAADSEVLLRAIESGAVRNMWPVGILSPSPADQRQTVRGIPVLGGFGDLHRACVDLAARGLEVRRLIVTASAFVADTGIADALMVARRFGVAVSRLPSLEDGGNPLQLAPVAVEDLLLRPSVVIDYRRLRELVRGRRVAVTGGGGSIGAEICRRLVTFGASRLLVIENSEPALHAVLEALSLVGGEVAVEGRIADVRDRRRLDGLFAAFAPEIVFHAAALKHVPLLECDWGEAVKTNVLGSVNVAEASLAAGTRALVLISTDKAIEPVSMLGATKRFAEMYCQALDAELARRHGGASPMRLIAVRFGNVLASNGSVIPKFKAQIEAGGPVTVTHPDMVRYFMTIREACDLVLTAASHALGPPPSDLSVYVLNMGQPVRIVDLAERMIRLSGLEPGRDIAVTYTGIRPGERLEERLFGREEPVFDIGVAGVVAAKPVFAPLDQMRARVVALEQAVLYGEREGVLHVLRDAVPDFRGVAA
ncbi:UDP-N-acetyl-alpha-D-glucosamine C6 dehydratase [Rhodoplanes serenus]|uniref:UDP-N-acetyl-alpha-D-glucosamine C6 dehydratase n=1 Tax=Rhodoplanes serenus TaxID=200615 RepID=A0A447CW25_9BRAD|nr:SDR family NAD(P)-dependent oxidoreductase [Rhodoplanes serenus]MBI5114683.1 polysaccharide biosynthesis protein [Rhodovulum sp.]VCU09508.1 UDP-N-acetyl-alpha-D-glucosamine C6 dehydratase [Rhodoplanes serenus]